MHLVQGASPGNTRTVTKSLTTVGLITSVNVMLRLSVGVTDITVCTVRVGQKHNVSLPRHNHARTHERNQQGSSKQAPATVWDAVLDPAKQYQYKKQLSHVNLFTEHSLPQYAS